jgi:RecA/RadA recombinase
MGAKTKKTKKVKKVKKVKKGRPEKSGLLTSSVMDELALVSKGISGWKTMDEASQSVVVPTIFPSFNRAMQVGGAPTGCIWLLHGPWGSGKTALSVGMIKSFQEHNHLTAFVDAELAAETKRWIPALGVETGACLYYEPETYEETADSIAKTLNNFRKGKKEGKIHPDRCFCMVVDSINKLVPEDELKKLGKVGKGYPLRAIMNSSMLNFLTPIVHKEYITFIILAQESIKIDAKQFEKKYKVKGGEQMWFDSTICIRVLGAREVKIGEGDDDKYIIGHRHPYVIEKNKVGIAKDMGAFFTSTGRGEIPMGFDFARGVAEEALKRNFFKKKGSWFGHSLLDDVEAMSDGGTVPIKDGRVNGKAALRRIMQYGIMDDETLLIDKIRCLLDDEIREQLADE